MVHRIQRKIIAIHFLFYTILIPNAIIHSLPKTYPSLHWKYMYNFLTQLSIFLPIVQPRLEYTIHLLRHPPD